MFAALSFGVWVSSGGTNNLTFSSVSTNSSIWSGQGKNLNWRGYFLKHLAKAVCS